MLLSGLDARNARELLTKHHDHLRLALREAQRSAVTPAQSFSAGRDEHARPDFCN